MQRGGQQTGPFYGTKNYLPQDVRMPIVELLNGTLADATVLLTQARFAHWNVKGMEFYGLHQLFDDLAETLEDHVEVVAERITALGGQARGTAGLAVSNCRLPQMPTDVTRGIEYVEILSDRLAIHDANLSEAIERVESYDDVDTADLLNEVSRDVSHFLWLLEAHLQTEPITGGGRQGVSGGGGQRIGGGVQGGGFQEQGLQGQSGGFQSGVRQETTGGQGFQPSPQTF
jgi:starvation-inducible DNA-binding protein